jgi:hypothetical protein
MEPEQAAAAVEQEPQAETHHPELQAQAETAQQTALPALVLLMQAAAAEHFTAVQAEQAAQAAELPVSMLEHQPQEQRI